MKPDLMVELMPGTDLPQPQAHLRFRLAMMN